MPHSRPATRHPGRAALGVGWVWAPSRLHTACALACADLL